MPISTATRTYDALLLVSFGGPERPEDVMPFLENVTAGRNVPRERLAEVAEHYYACGGSPINRQCRQLIAAIESDFAAHGLNLPVYWGNRNWDPYLTDTMLRMAADGVRRAMAFITAAYSSYSSCRQYREDIARAQREAGPDAPAVDKVRQYFNHPGFVEPMADATRRALGELPADKRDRAHIAFTAHSIPTAMAAASGPEGDAYARQLTETAGLVAERVDGSSGDVAGGGARTWKLVYQSRSGPPSQPWLEPDICDHLDEVHADGAEAVVVVPIGFVSDHLEVLHDLDAEAAQRAEKLGIRLARASTAGTDPRFVAMVRELVRERTSPDAPARSLGTLGPGHCECPANCCPSPYGEKPAAAGCGT